MWTQDKSAMDSMAMHSFRQYMPNSTVHFANNGEFCIIDCVVDAATKNPGVIPFVYVYGRSFAPDAISKFTKLRMAKEFVGREEPLARALGVSVYQIKEWQKEPQHDVATEKQTA